MKRTGALMVGLLFTLVLVGGSVSAGTRGHNPEIAVSPSVMQCVVDCIKREGNTAAAQSVCQLRCADIPMPDLGQNSGDCMGDFKKCAGACPVSDESCRQQCKQQLMQCK